MSSDRNHRKIHKLLLETPHSQGDLILKLCPKKMVSGLLVSNKLRDRTDSAGNPFTIRDRPIGHFLTLPPLFLGSICADLYISQEHCRVRSLRIKAISSRYFAIVSRCPRGGCSRGVAEFLKVDRRLPAICIGYPVSRSVIWHLFILRYHLWFGRFKR